MQPINAAGLIGIVTGVAGGIGAECAAWLREAGAEVVGVDRAEPPEFDVWMVRDLEQPDALMDALNRCRTLGGSAAPDFLVLAHGVSGRMPIQYMSETEWRRVLSANLDSVGYCLRAAAWVWNQWGATATQMSVVAIASMTGMIGNGPGFTNAHYAASKAGVIGLVKAAAIEMAPHGMRINAVCPGPILTPMLVNFREENPKLFGEFIGRVPLGRVGRPADVAAAVLYLVSRASSWVTGTTLMVDGGYTSQ